MNIFSTPIPDVLILEPKVFDDNRGFFFESYNQLKFNEQTGLNINFTQDNQSSSKQNVLRGLHYQIIQPQAKLVRTVVGSIFDVAVDIRKNSPNFGKSVGYELSAENKRQLWIPAGFAHGFVVRSQVAEVLYKTTDYYASGGDRTIIWNDSDLAIDWQITAPPILSAKDQAGKAFKDADVFA